MKQRNIWVVLLLNIVTLGIYQLFWTKFTRDEMVAKGQNIPRFIWLLVPIFLALALGVLLLVSLADAETTYDSYGDPELVMDATAGAIVVGLVASSILMIGISIWWFYRYSKAVEGVTNGHTSFGLAYGLWWVFNIFSVGFVWSLIIQDALNKVADGDNTIAGAGGNSTSRGQIADTPYPPIRHSASSTTTAPSDGDTPQAPSEERANTQPEGSSSDSSSSTDSDSNR